jgi:hypothetical protein
MRQKGSLHADRSARAANGDLPRPAFAKSTKMMPQGLDAAGKGGGSLVDEMWQEGKTPSNHLKLLPKRSRREATIVASHAPTLLFHLCARPISKGKSWLGRILCGPCDFTTAFLGLTSQ